jgi:hypothetical protein
VRQRQAAERVTVGPATSCNDRAPDSRRLAKADNGSIAIGTCRTATEQK